jgi:hypothetical protein
MNHESRMRRAAEVALLCVTWAGVPAAPARAHHSFAMYDVSVTKSFTGKLTRYVPGANHAQLIFQVLGPDGTPLMENGKPLQWGVETGSAASLGRQGVSPKTFPEGTIITLTLHPLRDGRPFGAMAGQLIKCGTTLPKGGCTKDTGQVFLTGNAEN